MIPENYAKELYHYGVLGMKWGVRRGKSQLAKYSKTDSLKARDRGIATLSKHQTKITKKNTKLDKKYTKLENKRNKQIEKSEVKSAKLDAKAAKKRDKAYGRFVSKKRSDKLAFKADKLEARSEKIKSLSKETQAKMDSNRKYHDVFTKGLSEIDTALTGLGKEYLRDLK